MSATFQVGARYWAQSAGDSNCVWWFTVTARTDNFITLDEDNGEHMRVRVRRGEHPDAEEWTMPFGTYSMAPVIRASRTADDLPPSLRPTEPHWSELAPDVLAGQVQLSNEIIAEVIAEEAFEAQGAAAFKAGERRIVPRSILVGDDQRVGHGPGINAAQAWYRGWDRANLAERVV